MSDTSVTDRERLPVLFVAAGRQRVGKTTFLNALVQYVRERGSEAALWNADQQNTTNNLAVYHPDVQVPPSQDPLDVQAWLEGRIQDQVENRYDAILDVGGGESAFSRLIRQARLAHSLKRRGIRIVLANVLGPDQADVDYLAGFTANDLFVPDDVLVVFNGGLILSGRSVKTAFEDIWSNPVVGSAIAKGARTLVFPALGCMKAVTDQALLFAEAMNGKAMEGHKPLSFLDQDRVAIWWEKDVPAVLGVLPPTFLPAMGGEAAAFAYHPPAAVPLGAAAD